MTTYNLSIPALTSAYAKGETTPRQRILSLRQQAVEQASFNAWIYLLTEEELEPYFLAIEGREASSLPLYGIPFAIKDNIDLAGVPTTAACPDYSYVPTAHAHIVKTLISAGAIPLGKTNMDQFATGLVGTRSPFGEGKNAFNKEYASGGSSSGSAIATALGQVSFALGTDTAGSGRVPAAFNNLIGHKPTKGLFSSTGLVPACRSLDCISVFSLTAEDAATVFTIAADYDRKDGFARQNTFENIDRYFSGRISKPFRFGVPSKLDFQGNTECEALFDKAVENLKELGGEAVLIDFSDFVDAAKLLYEGPWVAERWIATKSVETASMLPVIQNIIGSGNKASAADVFDAQYKLADFKRRCDEAIESFDFVVTPTTPTIFKITEINQEPIKRNSILGTYTNFMNLLDYCATAVPVGKTSVGVHWGVTIFTKAFNDIKLLNFASALQARIALPLGATEHQQEQAASANIVAPEDTIDVAVCGAHLEGQPLNWQLTERGGKLKRRGFSSQNYKLYALSDGKRPGMQRDRREGQKIELEVWSLPSASFGSFVHGIPAPLGIGKVELEDGTWVSGFICDHYGLEDATDISDHQSWRAWLQKT